MTAAFCFIGQPSPSFYFPGTLHQSYIRPFAEISRKRRFSRSQEHKENELLAGAVSNVVTTTKGRVSSANVTQSPINKFKRQLDASSTALSWMPRRCPRSKTCIVKDRPHCTVQFNASNWNCKTVQITGLKVFLTSLLPRKYQQRVDDGSGCLISIGIIMCTIWHWRHWNDSKAGSLVHQHSRAPSYARLKDRKSFVYPLSRAAACAI